MTTLDERPVAVCLKGPTAAGKTELALQLIRHYPMQIVSVDSAMVYRGMDIGTAKPAPEVLVEVPHRLIDIRNPWETYSAGNFREDARRAMQEISAAACTPLLVGGTMLYFHVLQAGLAPLPEADLGIRAEIDERAAVDGWPTLHAELQRIDPQSASRIQPTDQQRIQRALEVYRLAGEPLSQLQQETVADTGYRFVDIGLVPDDRSVLHRRIEDRFRQMMGAGFLDEVAGLLRHPQISEDSPALRAVGYRQLIGHLRSDVSLDEAKRQAVVATRRLAKRQLSWLRAQQGLVEVNCLDENPAERIMRLLDERAGFVQHLT